MSYSDLSGLVAAAKVKKSAEIVGSAIGIDTTGNGSNEVYWRLVTGETVVNSPPTAYT